jgi:hypothetical protein
MPRGGGRGRLRRGLRLLRRLRLMGCLRLLPCLLIAQWLLAGARLRLRRRRLLHPGQLGPWRLLGLRRERLRRASWRLVLGGERLAAPRRLAASRRRSARGTAARSRSAAGSVPVPWPLAASGQLSVALTHAAPRKLPVSRALTA